MLTELLSINLPQTHQKLIFIQLVHLILDLLLGYWGHYYKQTTSKKERHPEPYK